MDMKTIEKMYVCWNLYKNEISPEQIPKQIGVHRATVYRWINGMKKKGIKIFLRDFTRAKQGKRKRTETDPITKRYIWKIREERHECCGEKIQYFLKKEYGTKVSGSTIYRILNEKYVLRSKWKKNVVRGKTVLKASRAREALQFDTVDLGDIYAFTSIDICTREGTVILKDRLTAKAGEEAFIEQLKFYGHMEHAQRDGGPEFKAEWQRRVRGLGIRLRTARPYKKNEQAFIERFNGILRKECVGHIKYKKSDLPWLQQKINDYLHYYHHERPHLSLNMLTPHQFAMSHLI